MEMHMSAGVKKEQICEGFPPENMFADGGCDEPDAESSDELQRPLPLERWAPLGANEGDDESNPGSMLDMRYLGENEKLRHLEEEQEQLNASLLALTTHFAQVQFRLKQIVDAPLDEKEILLKDLEEFAFRGIPDTRCCVPLDEHGDLDEEEHSLKMIGQRKKQRELIEQLKEQLEELERYAYETGNAEVPQSMVFEKQKVIIDELKGKIPLNLDEFHALSPEELRRQVDRAINQLINPVKMKEQLVSQLKTQITDLERFIDFLQGEVASPGDKPNCTCNCPVHGHSHLSKTGSAAYGHASQGSTRKDPLKEKEMREKTSTAIKRALTLMQMFVATQLGCGSQQFYKNTLKRTMKGNHWGDLRAKLEMSVEKVLEIAAKQEQPVDSDYTSDSEEACTITCNEELTAAVRKLLAVSLRDLLQHGLIPVGQSNSLVPFVGCLSLKSSDSEQKSLHPWKLIMRYYEIKHGEQYNSTPARRLSQSFNLEIVGGQTITPKQTLLGAIDTVMSLHAPFKRNPDSHFKAFICAALNKKKLVTWLRLILRSRNLIEQYYQPWSYVAKTGFEDSYHSLERLNLIAFDLPVDLAVRPFQNIKDVF